MARFLTEKEIVDLLEEEDVSDPPDIPDFFQDDGEFSDAPTEVSEHDTENEMEDDGQEEENADEGEQERIRVWLFLWKKPL